MDTWASEVNQELWKYIDWFNKLPGLFHLVESWVCGQEIVSGCIMGRRQAGGCSWCSGQCSAGKPCADSLMIGRCHVENPMEETDKTPFLLHFYQNVINKSGMKETAAFILMCFGHLLCISIYWWVQHIEVQLFLCVVSTSAVSGSILPCEWGPGLHLH